MSKYNMGLWNYVQTGVINPEAAVKDWEDLAFNLVMSFEYDCEKHDKKEFIKGLDLCAQKNMKVIVCDKRTLWSTYIRAGEEHFRQGVSEAVKDFGNHPAVFGFHIGDEPSGSQMADMIKSYKIVKSVAPHLSPFVNFLPLWEEDNFKDILGVEPEGYKDLLNRVVKEAGIELLCYDYYGQCAYFDKEYNEALYFKNLRVFGEVARENNIPLFTTLLSVGHWSLRCPTEDDIKWQISTSVAMGVTGIFWFFIYERTLDGSYRLPPVDLFWERTQTFNSLSRQNRIFMRYNAPILENTEYDQAYAVGIPYAGLPLFTGGYGIEKIERVINDKAPLILSHFKGDEDKLVLVNADREYPVKLRISFSEGSDKTTNEVWIASGQMNII